VKSMLMKVRWEHSVRHYACRRGTHLKVTMEGKVWSRSIEITAGEVSVHADVTEK